MGGEGGMLSIELEVALRARNYFSILFSHTTLITSFLFKSIWGNYDSMEQTWGTDIYVFSIAHHLFCVFPRNKDGSCLLTLTVVSDLMQSLGVDQS